MQVTHQQVTTAEHVQREVGMMIVVGIKELAGQGVIFAHGGL